VGIFSFFEEKRCSELEWAMSLLRLEAGSSKIQVTKQTFYMFEGLLSPDLPMNLCSYRMNTHSCGVSIMQVIWRTSLVVSTPPTAHEISTNEIRVVL
jgi:hypothetical protein